MSLTPGKRKVNGCLKKGEVKPLVFCREADRGWQHMSVFDIVTGKDVSLIYSIKIQPKFLTYLETPFSGHRLERERLPKTS